MSVATQELLLAASDVQIEAAADKTPAVSIVAYTGGLMNVPGWGPLVIDLAGIDASASQVSILADHDATLSGVIGFGRAMVTSGKLLVAGTIAPTTEAARQVLDLARSGFQFQASVGVAPGESEQVRAGATVQVNGRTIKAGARGFTPLHSSVLKEVSIVPLGADPGTSVAIAASQEGQEAFMTTTEMTAEQIRAEAAAETERITAIRNVCAGRFGDIEARAIREGWDQQRAELEVLRASRPRGPFSGTTSTARSAAAGVAANQGRPWSGRPVVSDLGQGPRGHGRADLEDDAA